MDLDLYLPGVRLLMSGDVTELRALGVRIGRGRPYTVSGYFDDVRSLAAAAAAIDGNAMGIYATMNPVVPALLARSVNKTKAYPDAATSDKDITRRARLLVDCDPPRDAHISSTDVEHDAAIERAKEIGKHLRGLGWPAPALVDSGNGAQLLFAIDLPVDDGKLVQRVLQALDLQFSDGLVKVDTTNHNPARICKLPGTMTRKGDDTPERPHRRSKLLYCPPDGLQPVAQELLEALAAALPTEEPAAARRQSGSEWRTGGFDIDEWITASGLETRGPLPWGAGRKWILPTCPFDPGHNRGEAIIGEHASGAVFFKCHHDGCSGYRWYDLRDLVEPGWRDLRRDRASAEAAAPVAIGTELSPWVHALLTSNARLTALFEGRGKPAIGTDGRRLDSSSSGYDYTLALALAQKGVSDPAEIATVLWLRPGGAARAKGNDYITRTVERALELARTLASRKGKPAGPGGESGADIDFVVERIVIRDSQPPIYHLHIDDQVLILGIDDLIAPKRFKRRFTERLCRVPRLPGKGAHMAWDDYVNRWLESAEVQHQPPEASTRGLRKEEISAIIDNLGEAETAEDVDRGKAIRVGDRRGFRTRTVLRALREQGGEIGSHELCDLLRDLGCHSRNVRFDGTRVRVWVTPSAWPEADEADEPGDEMLEPAPEALAEDGEPGAEG